MLTNAAGKYCIVWLFPLGLEGPGFQLRLRRNHYGEEVLPHMPLSTQVWRNLDSFRKVNCEPGVLITSGCVENNISSLIHNSVCTQSCKSPHKIRATNAPQQHHYGFHTLTRGCLHESTRNSVRISIYEVNERECIYVLVLLTRFKYGYEKYIAILTTCCFHKT